MPDASFQFARVRAAGETLWHVHQSGRFIGTIAEVGGGYEATRRLESGAQTRRFANRDAAARWLEALTPTD